MLTALKQAIKALFSNPVRTGLTTLGIIIGISTVILVLSAGEGFRSLINSQLEAYGTNTLFIETRVPPSSKNRGAGAASNDSSRAGSAVAITTLKNRDLDSIERLPNIKGSYGMVVGQKVVSYKETAKSVLFYGASASRFDIDKGKLKSGRFYTQPEETGAAQVVILGNNLAQNLFADEDPLEKFIRVGDLNFQVIGVYEKRGGLGGGEDDTLYMPLNTAQKKLLGIDYLLFGIVEIYDSNLGSATAEDIRTVLRQNHNIDDPFKDDFFVQTQADALNTFNTIFNGITILLIAIAAIALVVGGVGIMNIMYVVVTERTAEIGLKKALGANNGDILREFLVESVLVTLIGGVVGIIFGSFLGWVVSLVASASGLAWTFSVPLYAILIGVGVSAAIGISFGVLPARQASKLDPIAALQYE
jgi:ABC-type antimicrobial peptide transport system permease subunit